MLEKKLSNKLVKFDNRSNTLLGAEAFRNKIASIEDVSFFNVRTTVESILERVDEAIRKAPAFEWLPKTILSDEQQQKRNERIARNEEHYKLYATIWKEQLCSKKEQHVGSETIVRDDVNQIIKRISKKTKAEKKSEEAVTTIEVKTKPRKKKVNLHEQQLNAMQEALMVLVNHLKKDSTVSAQEEEGQAEDAQTKSKSDGHLQSSFHQQVADFESKLTNLITSSAVQKRKPAAPSSSSNAKKKKRGSGRGDDNDDVSSYVPSEEEGETSNSSKRNFIATEDIAKDVISCEVIADSTLSKTMVFDNINIRNCNDDYFVDSIFRDFKEGTQEENEFANKFITVLKSTAQSWNKHETSTARRGDPLNSFLQNAIEKIIAEFNFPMYKPKLLGLLGTLQVSLTKQYTVDELAKQKPREQFLRELVNSFLLLDDSTNLMSILEAIDKMELIVC